MRSHDLGEMKIFVPSIGVVMLCNEAGCPSYDLKGPVGPLIVVPHGETTAQAITDTLAEHFNAYHAPPVIPRPRNGEEEDRGYVEPTVTGGAHTGFDPLDPTGVAEQLQSLRDRQPPDDDPIKGWPNRGHSDQDPS